MTPPATLYPRGKKLEDVKGDRQVWFQLLEQLEVFQRILGLLESGKGKGEGGRGEREEGRGKREEGRGKREEGRGKREEGRGKREEGRGKREGKKGEMGFAFINFFFFLCRYKGKLFNLLGTSY